MEPDDAGSPSMTSKGPGHLIHLFTQYYWARTNAQAL